MDKKNPVQGQDKPMDFNGTKYEELIDTVSDSTLELTCQVLV